MKRLVFLWLLVCQVGMCLAQVSVELSGSPGSRAMTLTLNGSGSWVSLFQTFVDAPFGSSTLANGSHASMLGSNREGIGDASLISPGPMRSSINTGGFQTGQYLPLDTPIPMTASAAPFSFNIVGIMIDDDEDVGAEDDISLITDQASTNTWPGGTTFGYTVGASSTLELDSTVGVNFDQTFIPGVYELNGSLVGSLSIVDPFLQWGFHMQFDTGSEISGRFYSDGVFPDSQGTGLHTFDPGTLSQFFWYGSGVWEVVDFLSSTEFTGVSFDWDRTNQDLSSISGLGIMQWGNGGVGQDVFQIQQAGMPTIRDGDLDPTSAGGLVGTLQLLRLTPVPSSLDFGDAPDTYRTLLTSNGAHHGSTGPQLGNSRDADVNGVPGAGADGDDNRASGDEDGVSFSPALGFDKGGGANSVQLTIVNGPADYEVWADWNIDGDFLDSGELASSGTLATGVHAVSINIPGTASTGSTYVRVRVYEPGTRIDIPFGLAASGEVEDYVVTVTDSTFVELLSFEGEGLVDGSVALRWQTGLETETAGFNVFRVSSMATDSSYQPIQLNDVLIPSRQTLAEGGTYEFMDSPGYGHHVYLLEEVESDGSKHTLGGRLVDLRPSLQIHRLDSGAIELFHSYKEGWRHSIEQGRQDDHGRYRWDALVGGHESSGRMTVPEVSPGFGLFRVVATEETVE